MRQAGLGTLVGLVALLAAPAHAERLDLTIADSEAAIDAYTGLEVVVVRLAPASSKALAEFTRNHVSRAVDLYVDDEHVMTVIVMEPIEDGVLQISSSGYPEGHLEELTRRLAAEPARVWMVVED